MSFGYQVLGFGGSGTSAFSGKTNSEGVFAYGDSGPVVNMSNKVSDVGVVSTDITGVGTIRYDTAATEYGGDKGIFAYGLNLSAPGYNISVSNLVSNSGVIATDTTGVGSARRTLAACSYSADKDKGIFAYGYVSGKVNMSNLVSNTGVVATDVTGVGTARNNPMATEYGGDKGIFAYGGDWVSMSNLVSNVGVVATDTTGVGTARQTGAACAYAGDKGIFGYGTSAGGITGVTNLVSNVGVIATDVAVVGTARYKIAACEYGNGKGIFGYGNSGAPAYTNFTITNLITTTGVVGADNTGAGTARGGLAACSFN